MNSKKQYKAPKFEYLNIQNEDIILASDCGPEDGDPPGITLNLADDVFNK